MPYFATINLQTVLRLVSILASQAYGSISIVRGGGGIPLRLVHAQTTETRPFLLLLFGPGNVARSGPQAHIRSIIKTSNHYFQRLLPLAENLFLCLVSSIKNKYGPEQFNSTSCFPLVASLINTCRRYIS